eukprot:TRINITY_DN37471_c0_g1_i1.p1 TRINITY_DN37471_c0_g1~~TRINITY_DN37471_c0_g1_i1.p1  ORF type:complete len:194 (+),score=42.53 TRINITY_DN37471_c0_g1_i1:57-638(+)
MAVETSGEELDLKTLVDEIVERNRHVVAIALVHSEGSEGDGQQPIVCGMNAPSKDACVACNSAFYEGEDAGSIELAGYKMVVAGRSEVGELVLVRLTADAAEVAVAADACKVSSVDCTDLKASSFLEKASSGDGTDAADAFAGLVAGAAPAAGAFLVSTQRWVMIVVHEAGMDATMTLRVCVGVAEHIIAEGQ